MTQVAYEVFSHCDSDAGFTNTDEIRGLKLDVDADVDLACPE